MDLKVNMTLSTVKALKKVDGPCAAGVLQYCIQLLLFVFITVCTKLLVEIDYQRANKYHRSHSICTVVEKINGLLTKILLDVAFF